jgi:hypothetical protein
MAADAPETMALVVVELKDVPKLDSGAPVVARADLANTAVRPSARCPFELLAPEMPIACDLSLRCHVDSSGTGTAEVGDLLWSCLVRGWSRDRCPPR